MGNRLKLLVLFFSVVLFYYPAYPGQSQCVVCHTNLKKLIRLCWEVEKLKPRPPASAENSGEG